MESESRLNARIDKVEDMSRIGSERISALTNEMCVMNVHVARIVKAVEGNGSTPLAIVLDRQEKRIDAICERLKDSKGWKTMIAGSAVGAVIFCAAGFVWSRAIGPINPPPAAVDYSRIEKVEKQQEQILKTLEGLKPKEGEATPPVTTPRRGTTRRPEPLPGPGARLDYEITSGRPPSEGGIEE